MRCNLKISLMLVLLVLHVTAKAQCREQQTANANLPSLSDVSVYAVSCRQSDLVGNIEIDVRVNGKTVRTLSAGYESFAYVLTLDTAIRFGSERSQGLGVSTGKGRDGTGMHYWKIPAAGFPIIDLGEAPELKRDRFMPNMYSSLISSSGEYHAVRYFYEIKNNRLVPTRSVGFSMARPKYFTATLADLKPSGEKIIRGRYTLSERSAELCMNGSASCW